MPRSMDFHPDLKLPAEAIAQIADDTRHGRTGSGSVRSSSTTRRTALPDRSQITDADDAALITGAGTVAAGLAVQVICPEHLIHSDADIDRRDFRAEPHCLPAIPSAEPWLAHTRN
jgi:hypothetical protein